MQTEYEAFACYNSKNLREVKVILEYLRNAHISVFFDEDILAGQIHDLTIDRAIKSSANILIFIGPDGMGPWQKEEMFSSHWEVVRESEKTIIPVILPGASIKHDDVPAFLRSRSAVQFKAAVEEEEPLHRLITGILRDTFDPRRSVLERPLTAREYWGLLESTVHAYDSSDMAELFYERWHQDIPLDKLEPFVECLSADAHILDAGCGPGHHSHYLAGKRFTVVGIDLAESALAIARKVKSQATFEKMDMMNMRYPNNSFDGVWACASCAHVPKDFLDRQLREFVRILKPGGYLGITLAIGRKSAVERDGRFFEGHTGVEEILRHYDLLHLNVVNISTSLTKKMTDPEIKQVTQWFAVIAESPKAKDTIHIVRE